MTAPVRDSSTMNPLRVVVVDDEPLAREGLRIRLEWIPGVEVVADCGSITTATEAIARLRPDVLYIDIQLAEGDGFMLLEQVERERLPAVVFVTAYAEYAVQAFRVGALDYLVKPFDDDTLRASVDRVRNHVDALQPKPPQPPAARLAVRDSEHQRVLYIPTSEIDWVEAAGDHVKIHHAGKSITVRSTMHEIEARLDATRFVRLHRGVIAAVGAIRELLPYSRGEYIALLADGSKVRLSRRNRSRVTAAIAQYSVRPG